MGFEKTEIDPVKYGVLWQRVQDMDKKMDKMERLQELRTEYGKVRRVEILSSLMTVYTMLELQTTDRGVL